MTRALAVTLAVLVALLGGIGCGSKDARSPGSTNDGRTIKKNGGPEPPVAGYMFAALRERTLGPFFARRGSGPAAAGLVAWVTVAEGSGRRILVIPIDARGAPRGGETAVATVSVDTTTLVVRPMRGAAPGFVVAWTSLTDRGKSLWAVAVGDDGAARAKPVELTRTTDDIVWIDIVPTDHGSVCLWAEETRGGDANLLAAALNTDGHVRGVPTRVAQGIAGWHALELPGGIGLSTVAAAQLDARARNAPERPLLREGRGGGALSFRRLDADAHALTPPVVITQKQVVSGDVEVVRSGKRLVFAWTDRTQEEPSVEIAALEDDGAPRGGRIEAPRKLAEARGGASLLALVSGAGGDGLAVMFEAPARRRAETRRIHATRVTPELTLARNAVSLEVVGRGQPELAATASGFAVLATVADCASDAANCANAQALATVLRTDASGAVVQREPLSFQADPATLGWGLTCDGDICFSLTASPSGPGSPSRIRTAVVRPRTNARPSTPAVAAPKSGVQVTDVTAIASGESVVDIATTRIGDAAIVAVLSARADQPERTTGREAKATAVNLTTRIVTDSGEASAPAVISNRALAVGGVAVAPAEKPEDGGAIAWVARENGDPEVHVTRIDKRGRRINDVQLTTTKGDASHVTINWAGGGWIVAWVDSRDGNGEVYATKVTPELTRITREERITTAPGDASDLVALARGTDVWLAWADPRESPREGLSDIYVSAVRMRDAKRVFEEQRILSTAAHSRTPRLAVNASGIHLAWIEEAPMDAETPNASGYGAFVAHLDPSSGRALERPTRLPLGGEGAATSVTLDSPAGHLRAIVARSSPEGLALDAVDLDGSGPRAASILTLDGPPSLDVALVLDGDILYFNDEGPRVADRRARRARIAWRKD